MGSIPPALLSVLFICVLTSIAASWAVELEMKPMLTMTSLTQDRTTGAI